MNIGERLDQEFSLDYGTADKVIRLLEQGNTVPFIARYRKEVTGGLEDTVLREFQTRYTYLLRLDEKKQDVLRKMNDLNVLTPELQSAIDLAVTPTELEDIYRPFRPKRRTRGVAAREKGFGPLGELYLRPDGEERERQEIIAALSEEYPEEEILQGALDVAAELISDRGDLRRMTKKFLERTAKLVSGPGKKEDPTYEMYFDYEEPYRQVADHRVLALNRGEKEEALKVNMVYPEELLFQQLHLWLKVDNPFEAERKAALEDGMKRLVLPSVERELRNALTERAEKSGIAVFAENLEPLLMQPPLRNVRILALDPGYRTGCKTVALDEYGNLLDHTVIFPVGSQRQRDSAMETVKRWLDEYEIKVVAIGNGTASRETEAMVAETITRYGSSAKYVMVNEAGASIYSASELGTQEFPDLDVTVRGAISIGRRIQDPLAELVKIEPKHIGVGQYQHDLPQKELARALDGVVENCVNRVGVDVNHASRSLLEHVAGLSSTVAQNIIDYRREKGITHRGELLKVPGLGPKTFTQSAGFLRIPESSNVLDHTAVHPESYDVAEKILALGDPHEITDFSGLAETLDVGEMTLRDIVEELKKPGRDPRDEVEPPLLRGDVVSMEDLQEGMELKGTVRNVVDFGAFVDIGVKEDGLIHVSKMQKTRFRREWKTPSAIVKVGDIVDVEVIGIDEKRGRISLRLLGETGKNPGDSRKK